ncbi:S-adenosyl-L-methionine-dependent methyltransferase [Aspergillus falconensis]
MPTDCSATTIASTKTRTTLSSRVTRHKLSALSRHLWEVLTFCLRRSPTSQTEELNDEYIRVISIQGREYQQYSIDNKISFEPVDEDEAERLDLQHRIFSRVFDNRLIFPPIPRLRRVLDCGYGTGSWAIDVAEQNPDCEVIGVDIYPFMIPDDTPENLWLQVDDLNRPFTFSSNHFDLVHSRLLAAGINRSRWPSYIQDIKRVLKPGGWVQLVEIYFNVQSDNGSITENHALRQWSSQLMRSMEEIKDLRVGTRLKTLLTAEGFREVDTKMIPLPLSAWPNSMRPVQNFPCMFVSDENPGVDRERDDVRPGGCHTSW